MVRTFGGLGLGLILAVLLAARGNSAPSSATPANSPNPMHVVLVKDRAVNCHDTCAEWISAEGDIIDATPAEFEQVFRKLGKRRLPVLIHSGGGSVKAAMAIGRAIRARHLDVVVSRSISMACLASTTPCTSSQPPGGAEAAISAQYSVCASACTLILAAGQQRLTPTWTRIGVHEMWEFRTFVRLKRLFRVTRKIEQGVPVEVSRKLISEKQVSSKIVEGEATHNDYKPVGAYLKEMGIDQSLMPLMLATPHDQIHWMTNDELSGTKLSTGDTTAQALLGVPLPPAPRQLALPARPPETLTAHQSLSLDLPGKPGATVDVTFQLRRALRSVDVSLQPMSAGTRIDVSAMTGLLTDANGWSYPAASLPNFHPCYALFASIPLASLCKSGLHTGPSFVVAISAGAGAQKSQTALATGAQSELARLYGEACGR